MSKEAPAPVSGLFRPGKSTDLIVDVALFGSVTTSSTRLRPPVVPAGVLRPSTSTSSVASSVLFALKGLTWPDSSSRTAVMVGFGATLSSRKNTN